MTKQSAAALPSARTVVSQVDAQRAQVRAIHKPWGTLNLEPWSRVPTDGDPVGELWFDRASAAETPSALLLKLLFTEQRLSIQVHPGDAYAHSIGQANGKTEAWYILSARPGAEVGLGLTASLSEAELRTAVMDGSIADLLKWRPVRAGETIFIPAGTIHAIGPGLVIAEIQQRSDTTFRLFDYGRGRSLNVDQAVAVADAGPAAPQPLSDRLTDSRTILIADGPFVIEQITLFSSVRHRLTAAGETWVMGVAGSLTVDGIELEPGQVAYLPSGQAEMASNSTRAVALVAYCGPLTASGLAQQRRQSEVFP